MIDLGGKVVPSTERTDPHISERKAFTRDLRQTNATSFVIVIGSSDTLVVSGLLATEAPQCCPPI
jgi:hypothetical protein